MEHRKRDLDGREFIFGRKGRPIIAHCYLIAFVIIIWIYFRGLHLYFIVFEKSRVRS